MCGTFERANVLNQSCLPLFSHVIRPACWDVAQLETMMDCGMNVARLNFSHGDHAGHGAVLDRIREAAANKQKNVGKCFFGVDC
jgi:hypothetical protein